MVLIAIGLPEEYALIVDAYRTGTGMIEDYETGFAGLSHAQLSGEVLKSWHLPAPIAVAVGAHHGPHATDVAHPLSRMVELAATMAEQQGILAQPWMRSPDGEPAGILASLGLEEKSGAILSTFQEEYGTIKAFFS